MSTASIHMPFKNFAKPTSATRKNGVSRSKYDGPDATVAYGGILWAAWIVFAMHAHWRHGKLKRILIVQNVAAMTLLIGMHVACVGPGWQEDTTTPVKRTQPRRLVCDNGIEYRMDRDDPRWYRIDENGQRVYEDCPCARDSKAPNGDPGTREEAGLAVDANGNVAPRMWITDHAPIKPGEYNVDDIVDFVICTERDWEMPHDVDLDLAESIGVDRFNYVKVDLDTPENDWILYVTMDNVKLSQVIQYLDAMGMSEIKTNYNGSGPYTIRLDGAVPNDYDSAQIFNDADKLIAEIKLR